MKKILISSVIASILTGVIGPVVQVSALEQTSNEPSAIVSEGKNEEKLVPVTLYSDEDTIIIAEVPESYEEEYVQKLQNEDFRKQEIANSSDALETQSDFPIQATSSSTVRYMGRNDVLHVLDHMNASGNWLRYLSNPLTDGALGAAARLLTGSNFVGAAVTVLTWGAADLMARQQAWWNDSAMMILRGQIRGVKLTITPSGKDYPKVYRTLTRY